MKLCYVFVLVSLSLAFSRLAAAQTAETQTWDGITVKCRKLGFQGMQAEGLELIKSTRIALP
jgi:hypothetical protein